MAEGNASIITIDDDDEDDIPRTTPQQQASAHQKSVRSPVWSYFSVTDLERKD